MNNGGTMNKIIGHEKVQKVLEKIILDNKVGHAYLFLGKDGIGKKLMAVNFAEMIMSKEGSFNEADYQIIEPEKDIIKVEVIRNLINEIYIKPTYSSKKVIIINDADKMNSSAQNALLKVLEEPPLYATLILITSNKEKIIRTILSRVTEVRFNDLSINELEAIVGNGIDMTYARGSASKALSLIENNCYEDSKDLLELFEKKNFIDINKKISTLKSSTDIVKVFELIKVMYHKDIKNDTYKKVKIINLLDETIQNLSRNANIDLALDRLIIKICEV